MSEKSSISRRAFLAATTTTAIVASTRVNAAEVVPGKTSPNEKLNMAAIGAGGKGFGDIMNFRRENIVALADPDWNRAGECFYKNPQARKFRDFRQMLDEVPEIDAVTISTPDHMHAPAAHVAMSLGKHVYVQKPLTHTIAEARYLTRLREETGVKTQMGNQGHAGDGVRELCEMIWSGAVGQIREAHIWTNRPIWPQGIPDALPEEAIPDTMDWDVWIGAAPMRPYNAKYAPFNWRGWWDFGCGALGDMACHIMDPANWALKLNDADTFTCEVVSEEGNNDQTFPTKSIVKFTFPARGDMAPVDVFWYDGGLQPDRPEGVPEDDQMGDGNNGSIFIGETGVLTSGEYGGESRFLPSALMADYERPAESIPRVRMESPYREFAEAIKEGGEAGSNFGYAGPFVETVNMAMVALRTMDTIEYDRTTGRITNDEAANQWLSKEYRAGWEVPV